MLTGFLAFDGLPNVLSAFRIVASPLLAWAVLTDQAPAFALIVAAAAALSDLCDGLAARAQGRVTALGALLDPLADKIFILTALSLLWAKGGVEDLPAWAVLIIVWRELLILGLRGCALLPRASVLLSAKIKTATEFLAVLLLLASPVSPQYARLFFDAGTILLWVSAILAVYSGASYLRHARRRKWQSL